MNYRKDFAERLRMAIAKKDLRRAEFARLAGIHSNTVTDYTKGRTLPDAEIVKNIAEVLDVDANWLLGVNR